MTPVKGHDVLVDALAAVADRPWTCVCAGPLDRTPDHVAEVRRRIAAPGSPTACGSSARWTRPRSTPPTPPPTSPSCASRTETYGMAAAEALARGLPLRRDDGRRPARHRRPRPRRHPPRPARPARRPGRPSPPRCAGGSTSPPCVPSCAPPRPPRAASPPQLARDGRRPSRRPSSPACPPRAAPRPPGDGAALPDRASPPRTWRTGRDDAPSSASAPTAHGPLPRDPASTAHGMRPTLPRAAVRRRRTPGPSRRGAAPGRAARPAPVAVRGARSDALPGVPSARGRAGRHG